MKLDMIKHKNNSISFDISEGALVPFPSRVKKSTRVPDRLYGVYENDVLLGFSPTVNEAWNILNKLKYDHIGSVPASYAKYFYYDKSHDGLTISYINTNYIFATNKILCKLEIKPIERIHGSNI